MSIIVDGYNYIGHSRELELQDPGARDQVIYLMGQYCARVKKSLTLIFDGNYFVHLANRKRRYDRVTVIYTSPIYSADEAIKKMIKSQEVRRRKSMLVVSSDQEILQYAQAHGTQVIKSEAFERQVYETLAEKKGIDRVHIRISAEEVKEWLDIFGSEPAETPASSRITTHTAGSGANKHGGERHVQKEIRKPSAQKQKKKASGPPKPSLTCPDDDVEAARINIHLSAKEVEEWMALFGGEDEE